VDMDISMDIQRKCADIDMDVDGKFHIHGKPASTPLREAGTRFTYPKGMEVRVDLGVGYIPRWFTCS